MNNASLPLIWFLFASLTILGSLIYNVSMKVGGSVNAVSFAMIVTVAAFFFEGITFLIAKYGFQMNMAEGVDTRGIMFACAAGFAAALIDVCCFMALRSGTLTQLQCYWTIGSVIALVIVSYIFFKEPMPPMKIAGVVLGVVSLFLVIRS